MEHPTFTPMFRNGFAVHGKHYRKVRKRLAVFKVTCLLCLNARGKQPARGRGKKKDNSPPVITSKSTPKLVCKVRPLQDGLARQGRPLHERSVGRRFCVCVLLILDQQIALPPPLPMSHW
eukprot:3453552-Amphidinium_carterae.1